MFEFVPTIPEERELVLSESSTEQKAVQVWAHYLAERVRKWSFEEEITTENFLIMKPTLLARMAAIVLFGSDPGDPHQDLVGDKQRNQAVYKSALNGSAYQDEKQQASEKNSTAASA